MNGDLYILNDDGSVTGMNEKGYDKEVELQKIIAKTPSLLARPTDGEDYQIYLVKQEQPLRAYDANTTYWLDHFCVDSDNVPVLVEVKRSTDSRIHREVVGQLLDYTAHIQTVDIDEIKKNFSENDLINWDEVVNNIQANRMKLVFVADEIPSTLKVMIEFLDKNFQTMDVYGVELKIHDSEGKVILCRSFVESTVKAVRRVNEKTQWTEETFLERVSNAAGQEVADTARAFIKQGESLGYDVRYGKGQSHASVLFYTAKSQSSVFSIYAGKTSNISIKINSSPLSMATNGRISYTDVLTSLRN